MKVRKLKGTIDQEWPLCIKRPTSETNNNVNHKSNMNQFNTFANLSWFYKCSGLHS